MSRHRAARACGLALAEPAGGAQCAERRAASRLLETAFDELEKDKCDPGAGPRGPRPGVLRGRRPRAHGKGGEDDPGAVAARGRRASRSCSTACTRIAKPLVARVQGPAFAGGMGLVAACDLVVAARGSRVRLPEVRIGLVPAMISPYLVRAMGEQQARRYMLTGERLAAARGAAPRVRARVRASRRAGRGGGQNLRAARAGRAGRACALEEAAARWQAAPISPAVVAGTAAVLAEARAGAEAREGIRAFLEKRKPGWQ